MIEATSSAFVLFFALSTAVVILGVFILKKRQLMNYLGIAYMASMILKMAFFTLFFYSFLAELELLTKAERARPLIPLFMGLIAEVFTIIKLVKDD